MEKLEELNLVNSLEIATLKIALFKDLPMFCFRNTLSSKWSTLERKVKSYVHKYKSAVISYEILIFCFLNIYKNCLFIAQGFCHDNNPKLVTGILSRFTEQHFRKKGP